MVFTHTLTVYMIHFFPLIRASFFLSTPIFMPIDSKLVDILRIVSKNIHGISVLGCSIVAQGLLRRHFEIYGRVCWGALTFTFVTWNNLSNASGARHKTQKFSMKQAISYFWEAKCLLWNVSHMSWYWIWKPLYNIKNKKEITNIVHRKLFLCNQTTSFLVQV